MSFQIQICENKQLAEAIAETFYRVSSDMTPLQFQPNPLTNVPDLYTIPPEAVDVQLSRIKVRKATGPRRNSELASEKFRRQFKLTNFFYF